ncbi:hypothetical protein [Mangrovibacterium lignilyticum]|uniref:hypothetical protein n=1 Tax=Mangrovibacterium lignilyticum TaxID=2668052 RepID=UPI0013D83A88|nr:hypothetical protein [Mangrovibacterium lignilyticum]
MKIALVALAVFLLNLPFGALRGRERKYSFKWFLYIHLPIPFVILLRIYSDIGFALYTYPILVGAFFGGQVIGRKFIKLKPQTASKETKDKQ